jgi:hypothetical protein
VLEQTSISDKVSSRQTILLRTGFDIPIRLQPPAPPHPQPARVQPLVIHKQTTLPLKPGSPVKPTFPIKLASPMKPASPRKLHFPPIQNVKANLAKPPGSPEKPTKTVAQIDKENVGKMLEFTSEIVTAEKPKPQVEPDTIIVRADRPNVMQDKTNNGLNKQKEKTAEAAMSVLWYHLFERWHEC